MTRLDVSNRIWVWDEFTRADGNLGTTPWGATWKQSTPNFTITSGAAVKATGSGTNRYFALLPTGISDLEINAVIHTNPTTNLTDIGFALRSLDSTSSRGGQLYVSIRKTASANSIRIMQRTDTSGTDTQLAINAAAGWADNTDYTVRIVASGSVITVYVDGTQKLTWTLTAPQLAALTGTDVGISVTNTDTGSSIKDFYVLDPALQTTPATTTTLLLGHRGTPGSAPDTTEEQATGLALLPAATNGPEVDARKTSNGDYYLCHDTTFDRTSPNSTTGSCTNASTATWIASGLAELSAYLDACVPYNWTRIIVQAEMNSQADINGLVAILNAHRLRSRIIVMTSATGGATPMLAEIRTAGWTGMLGCYGLNATNWAGGISASFSSYKLNPTGADMLGFLELGDDGYDTNVGMISTLHAAGYLVGASTITPNRFRTAVAAGVDVVLTDYPAEFLAWYTPPANAALATTRLPALTADSAFNIAPDFAI